MEEIGANWKLFSHDHQYPPDLSANGKAWLTWLMIGGRGAGKTRAGAEWIRAQALGISPLATEKASRIALVGETEHDVREVMIEGVSGLLAVHAIRAVHGRAPMPIQRRDLHELMQRFPDRNTCFQRCFCTGEPRRHRQVGRDDI